MTKNRSIIDVLRYFERIGEEYKNMLSEIMGEGRQNKEAWKEALAELAAKTLGALQAYADIQEASISKNYKDRDYTHRSEEYKKQ